MVLEIIAIKIYKIADIGNIRRRHLLFVDA